MDAIQSTSSKLASALLVLRIQLEKDQHTKKQIHLFGKGLGFPDMSITGSCIHTCLHHAELLSYSKNIPTQIEPRNILNV